MPYLLPVLLILLLLAHLWRRESRRGLRLRRPVPVVTFAPSSAPYPGRVRRPYESPSARAHYAQAPSVQTGGTMALCRSMSSIRRESVATLAGSSIPSSTWQWPTRYTPPLVTPGNPGPVSRREVTR